jgi:DNA repair exonuclease SbcCD ATPase subunit
VRLTGKNFQSWADFDLTIDGLTILTGPSDVGKSAIFRALKGVLRNELPAEFVRNGQDDPMEITVEIDSHKVTATRKRKGSTTYVIDGQDYAKLARAAPDDLKKLNFNEVLIGDFDFDPIFGRQNAAQFLIDPLTYKPQEVNAILGAFGGTEKLEGGKKEANTRKTQKDAEARTLATQIRESEERKAELVIMQAKGEVIKSTLQYLELEVNQLETEILWLDAAVRYRQKIEPLRQIMEALVLPDITGLAALQDQVFYAEEAALAASYAKWLAKPIATLSSVAATWGEAKIIWAEIAAIEAAVEAGKHVVSTDRLKGALVGVEATFGEAVRLWRGIRYAEDLCALLGDITDSAEQLAGVEIELAAAQAELKKSSCPKCGKSLEHLCQ